MSAAAPNSPTVPSDTLLESGDFIFFKKRGAWVPYIRREAGQLPSPAEEEAEWNGAKQQFLATLKEKFPYFSDQQIEAIRRLSFAEFYAMYVGTFIPNEPLVLSQGLSLYLGHVGIVQVEAGRRWVIEALGDRGVVKRRYEDWITGPDDMIWAGRLNDLSSELRQSVSNEAAKYIGKPYNFWNLDLNDDREFYCSKLAWMAIFRALEFAIDGNSNPKRWFWFSPKQLLHEPAMKIFFSPGIYLR